MSSGSRTRVRPHSIHLERATQLLRAGGVAVLSGAGLSTESGIPDYRGPTGRARESSPIQYREFVSSEDARRRYWARSTVGWPFVRSARPNPGHLAVAELERMGVVSGIITQNVDGLHHAAGSRSVVELHGSLSRVVCLGCGSTQSRDRLQTRMVRDNPGWDLLAARKTPDGDAVLPQTLIDSFSVPDCADCGGALKPAVVFFGENVPSDVVASAWELLDRSRTLLVLGSSLTVYSGFRFVDRAVREGKPVIVITMGPTRADPAATLKIELPLGETLTELTRRVLRA